MRVRALIKRIIKQFLRDKRSLALLVVAPILILTLIWLVLDGNDYDPVIATENVPSHVDEALQVILEKEIIHLSEEEAKDAFETGELDAYFTIKGNEPYLLMEGSDPTVNGAVEKSIHQALQTVTAATTNSPTIDYFYGSETLNLFDQIGAVLIGFFIFFFVFIIGGISFLRERTQGTLEKLLSTPIKRWEVVLGYLLGFGFFTIIQAVIIAVYSVYVLDIWMTGEFWQLLVVTFLLAITALTLATLLSAFANNEFQIMQFIPVVIIPQFFFAGIFNLETMDEWLQVLSKFMPLTYGSSALQQIMIKGASITEISQDLFILLGFAVIFFILNIVALKKHRRL